MPTKKIPFNIPPQSKNELRYITEGLANRKLSGDGVFSKRCSHWLTEHLNCHLTVMTPSCTSALEMAMVLADIMPGDEVIVPSFTFTSTATAPLLFGAIPVFVDIDPDTMNMNINCVEQAISPKTKVIIPVHYAGVACDMKPLMSLAERYNLIVVADAAQAIFSSYNDKPTGSWGHMAAYSFHETKNIVCGEGGALAINDARFKERAEIVRDKGTNRQMFLNGQVDKYTWLDKGSSYLLPEIAAALLYAQLEQGAEFTERRMSHWLMYHTGLEALENNQHLQRMHIPPNRIANAHIYYIKLNSAEVTRELLRYLNNEGIQATTHYVPLHSAAAGIKFGCTPEPLKVTEDLAYRILRLPLYADLQSENINFICEQIEIFFKDRS
jgi:dTDP-4-amino-4,6-dideoxygalactose transaminase